MYPALRDQHDQDYLWQAIETGWLNAVSTDHCGFDFETQTVMGKDDFRDIPNGAPGYDADVVIYEPEVEHTISYQSSLQGTDYNTFEGFKQKGKTDTVFLRGQKIVEAGEYIGEKGQGKFVSGKPYALAYERVGK